MRTELKRWIKTDRCWNRKEVSRGSPESTFNRQPTSHKKSNYYYYHHHHHHHYYYYYYISSSHHHFIIIDITSWYSITQSAKFKRKTDRTPFGRGVHCVYHSGHNCVDKLMWIVLILCNHVLWVTTWPVNIVEMTTVTEINMYVSICVCSKEDGFLRKIHAAQVLLPAVLRARQRAGI